MNSSRRICEIRKHKVIEEMYQTRKELSHEAGFRSVHTMTQICWGWSKDEPGLKSEKKGHYRHMGR